MKKIINLLTVVTISLTLYSCTKDDSTNNTTTNNPYTEDPNNFITATFLGKTLKTSGIQGLTILGDVLYQLNTYNSSGIVNSSMVIVAYGSSINNYSNGSFKPSYQSINVQFFGDKFGNGVGNYKTNSTSTITDVLTSKQYNFDTSTVLTVSSIDTIGIQGTYTGKLIDGTTKIPVTGTFKLRKL
jgi:hypothetical protein